MSENMSEIQQRDLILQVQAYRNAPLPAALQARFGIAGGILGRAPGNDLVLDDPSKFISRVHARVAWRDGGYRLADEGVNPSIVDGRPLGAGHDAPLADGSRIVIGDYTLLATLEALPESDATALQPPAVSTPAALPPFEPPPAPVPAPLPPFEPPAPPVPGRDVGPTDALAGARILDDAAGAADGTDPLGLNLFAGIAQPPAVAPGEYVAPAWRGTEGDHAAPQLQVFALPAAGAIPDGYDPLADLLPPASAPTPAPAAVVAEAVPASATPPAPVAAAPAPAADAVLDALLDGLGLPQLRGMRPPEALAREVGAMLRVAVGGTIDVLMARTLTKRESRIDLTMIAPRANNPLKFFPDADTALAQMLGARLPGYMAPLDALAGAFDDLKAHELAVIAGMRAALAAVAQRFDPARIEGRMADPGRLERLLPAARKARLWDRLAETYAELARDADEDLQRLFGEKFSKAYEEQVERLRRERQ
nr:type VI secretion system-associated FHA domain protein TagH [uncultured Massilia sp.]